MKTILIEPNPIMNQGLSIFLNENNVIDFIKSYSSFNQLLSHSYVKKHVFSCDLIIVNIAHQSHQDGLNQIVKLDGLLERKKIIIIFENRLQSSINYTQQNEVFFIDIRNGLYDLEKLIDSI